MLHSFEKVNGRDRTGDEGRPDCFEDLQGRRSEASIKGVATAANRYESRDVCIAHRGVDLTALFEGRREIA